ncbi:Hypothetical predicted protein [Olea europaea subsp. europaea]|uniref:Uncharacterized protein n=1 Tax=Olea europaea subsp. europaea TaxID=158383 RepID=A0A8S0PGW2_OLEEU|nr:Hypothetical predicted protein [Olea europaea subsp. europaea]
MKCILYKKPLQPHVREDMQFGDTGDAGSSAHAQSPNRPQLLMITDGCKGHSSDVEDDDDDDDFVDTLPKRKKTHSRFHPPTEEHATREYYPTELEGHDMHISPQPQATHADDELQPAVFEKLKAELRGQMSKLQCTNKDLTVQLKDLKSQLLDLKRDRSSQIDHIIRVQAGVVNDCEIEEQADVATKTGSPPSAPTSGLPVKRAPKPTWILQSSYVTGAGKQIKHSNDAIVFDKHADEADVVAFQNWFNRAYGRLFSLSATVYPEKLRCKIVCYHN